MGRDNFISSFPSVKVPVRDIILIYKTNNSCIFSYLTPFSIILFFNFLWPNVVRLCIPRTSFQFYDSPSYRFLDSHSFYFCFPILFNMLSVLIWLSLWILIRFYHLILQQRVFLVWYDLIFQHSSLASSLYQLYYGTILPAFFHVCLFYLNNQCHLDQ